MNKTQSATLTIPGKTDLSLKLLPSVYGPPVMEVKDLISNGIFTYDPGFISTAACESDITYIDGDKGILLYRGYPIEEIAELLDYPTTAYLLLHGELPNAEQSKAFVTDIKQHTMVHEQLHNFFNGFPINSHPMAILCSVTGALSAFYHKSFDPENPEDRLLACIRLIAKVPTLVAMSYKYTIGQPFMYPDNNLGYAENFLHMMFGVPCEETPLNPMLARALDRVLVLHADHEQNASTSAVRLCGSTGADPFACIAGGIAALWGPAHGGANEAALNMLQEIDSEDNIGKFIARAKDKNDSFRLMGFGHRVYRSHDPRAKVMRQTCHEVLEILDRKDEPLFRIALKLEQIALQDEYFIDKKLYPNVDFYSGIILKALGIPTVMFTSIFAAGRAAGWIAHWKEMHEKGFRIGRPRQRYTGHKQRSVSKTEPR